MSTMRDEVRAFVRERVVELEPHLLGHEYPALDAGIERLRAEVKANGWWAPQVPKELGGGGLSLLEHGALSEELGWSPLGHVVFGCQAPDAGNIEVLAEIATPEQKERWLVPLVAGEIRSCFAMTEPEHAGSEPTRMSSTARLDDDEWVLDGHKWFVTGADGAALAVVMAVTDPDAEPHERASMFLVPTVAPGFELARIISVMGETGHGVHSHAEIFLRGCRVPASSILGERGRGFAIAQMRLGPGRIHHCMRWIGVAERAFAQMCRRAVERHVKGGRLGDQQGIRAWIAESRADIDAARLMVMHAAARIEAEGTRAAQVEISTIKFHSAAMLDRVLDRALQVLGALGMTDDTVLAWHYRHERAARIYDGPDEVHKLVVARHALRAFE